MYTFFVAIAFGTVVGIAVDRVHLWEGGWAIFAGGIIGLGFLAIFTKIFSKRLQNIFNGINTRILAARDEANKIAQRQGRLSPNVLQKKIEQVMNKAIDDAIEMMDQAKPLYGWAFMAEKQVNTSKMQMCFQNKRFEEVDKLLPKCLFLDPLSLAMKMTREYKHGDMDKVEKSYEKGRKRFKGEKLIIIYSTYAWMLLKKKNIEKAVEVLGQAKEKTVNESITKNWQAVANNKPGQFSNAFLGEQWYALHLEQPKQKRGSAKAAMKNDPRMGKINRKMR